MTLLLKITQSVGLPVKNTFIHLKDSPEIVFKHAGRSSSAPPACQASVSDDINRGSDSADSPLILPSEPTSTDTSAPNSGSSSKAGTSTDSADAKHSNDEESERARHRSDTASSLGGMESAGDEPEERPEVPAAVQHDLDVMSKTIMELWATLGALQAEQTPDAPVADPCSHNAQPAEVSNAEPAGLYRTPPTSKPATSRPSPSSCKSSRKHAKSRCLQPSHKSLQEINDVLQGAKHALDSVANVSSAEVEMASPGTIARLAITMVPKSPETSYAIASAILKAALLDAAFSSDSVYVLGYEATPFENDACGQGFVATLAIAPSSWEESTACWETYQKGVCPRGPTCSWLHPGKNGIQPIRVVFS